MVRSWAELGWNPAVPDAWGPYISFVNWLATGRSHANTMWFTFFIEDVTRVYTFSPGPEPRIAESVEEPPQSTISILAQGDVKAGCAAVYSLCVSEGSRQGRLLAVPPAALGSECCFPRTLMFSRSFTLPRWLPSCATKPLSHTTPPPHQLPRCCCSPSVSKELHTAGACW